MYKKNFQGTANQLPLFDGVLWMMRVLELLWNAPMEKIFLLIMSSWPFRLVSLSISMRNCFVPNYLLKKSRRLTSWAMDMSTKSFSNTRGLFGFGEKAISSWLGLLKNWRIDVTGWKVIFILPNISYALTIS